MPGAGWLASAGQAEHPFADDVAPDLLRSALTPLPATPRAATVVPTDSGAAIGLLGTLLTAAMLTGIAEAARDASVTHAK